MRHRLQRVIQLRELLETHIVRPRLDELAAQLGVSEATVRRDLDVLRAVGVLEALVPAGAKGVS